MYGVPLLSFSKAILCTRLLIQTRAKCHWLQGRISGSFGICVSVFLAEFHSSQKSESSQMDKLSPLLTVTIMCSSPRILLSSRARWRPILYFPSQWTILGNAFEQFPTQLQTMPGGEQNIRELLCALHRMERVGLTAENGSVDKKWFAVHLSQSLYEELLHGWAQSSLVNAEIQ